MRQLSKLTLHCVNRSTRGGRTLLAARRAVRASCPASGCRVPGTPPSENTFRARPQAAATRTSGDIPSIKTACIDMHCAKNCLATLRHNSSKLEVNVGLCSSCHMVSGVIAREMVLDVVNNGSMAASPRAFSPKASSNRVCKLDAILSLRRRHEVLDRLLDGSTDIVVAGDSMMRQLFVRLIQMLRGRWRVFDYRVRADLPCEHVATGLVLAVRMRESGACSVD